MPKRKSECLEHHETGKQPAYSRKELRDGLKASLADGTLSSVQSTVTGTYAVPFALQVGASAGEIGILTGVPKLLGTIIQPWVGRIIVRFGGRKHTSILMSLVSRLMWLPILLLPFVFGPILPGGNWLMAALIILVGFSQLASSISITTWSSWIGDFVPERIRGRFFGKRGAMASIAGLLATIAGGALLGSISGVSGYALLFMVSVITGVLATFYSSRVPAPLVHDSCAGPLLTEFKNEFKRDKDFAKFTLFIALNSFAVYMASPFFAVSMLNSFNIGLPMYAVVTSVSVIATILSQPYWGKFADKFGDRTTVAICSVLIALVPGLWLLVQNPMQMMLVYIESGFAWAGFDLAVFNYLLDSTPENKRSSYIANYTTFVGLATFLGPLAGGMLAVFAQGSMLIGSGLGLVFAISVVQRLATAGALIPHLRELRAKRVPHMSVIFWRAVTVYPLRFFAQEIAIAPHWLHHRLSTKRLL